MKSSGKKMYQKVNLKFTKFITVNDKNVTNILRDK